MKSNIIGFFLIFIFVFSIETICQNKKQIEPNSRVINGTLGIHYGLLSPNRFIQDVTFSESLDNIEYKINVNGGYVFGMELRADLRKRLALITGINITQRSYYAIVNDLNIIDSAKIKSVVYEVPIMGLIYVRLSERIYMNNAFGFCINFVPSNIKAFGENYIHFGVRNSWIQNGLLGNLGWEYRSPNQGTYYLGFTYQKLFSTLFYSNIRYEKNDYLKDIQFKIPGDYFSISLKYFFPIRENK